MKTPSSCSETPESKAPRNKGHKRHKITSCGGKYYYDAAAADKAVGFFEKYLVHVKGRWAGKPFILEPWQRDEIVKPLFGWKRKSDGLRRFRVFWGEVPKKNGKSGLASGIALLLLAGDREPGAEIYGAAVDKDQAKIVYNVAEEMVNASAKLKRFIVPGKKAIYVPKLKATYTAVSSETANKHGISPHGVIIDEVHAHKTPDLIDILTSGSTAARTQPLFFFITTAGWDRTSICWEYHEDALKVLEDERVNEEQLVCIYAANPEDDWRDPKTWRAANPSLGATMTEEGIRKEFEMVLRKPRKQNEFKQLRLNMWTQQASIWLPLSKWDEGKAPVNIDELRGMKCWGGLDLSSSVDLSAFVLLFKLQDRFKVLPWFFMPKENIAEREHRDAVMYQTWVEQGLITATEGDLIDYNVIQSRIEDAKELFDLQQIGFDPYNSTQIITGLESKYGKSSKPFMVPVRQGMLTLSPPTKEFERLVLGKKIEHGGNPVLRWMIGNTSTESDAADNIKPIKKRGTARIDGVIGMITALERYMRTPGPKESVYEKRDIRTF